MLPMICATFGSVMMNVLYVIIAIAVLLVMVTIHELGHYVTGKILGFKIKEFSVGFGKVLWQKTNKSGEKISIRLFPLGGFCQFDGEGDSEEEQENSEKIVQIENKNLKENDSQQIVVENKKDVKLKAKSKNKSKNLRNTLYNDESGKFNDKAPWKRIIVFFGGVTFNFISAFIFAIIFLLVGGYDGYLLKPAQDYSVQYSYVNESGVTEYGSLVNGEYITVTAINGTEINYAKTHVFSELVDPDDTTITLTIIAEGGELKDITLERIHKDENGKNIFGIEYISHNISYGLLDVLRDFVPFTFNVSVLILKAFWQIITGQIALNQLGGPVSTITQMTQIASYGLASFLYLLPMLAANLAIFNILPIPGLDGAHVVFTTIEWIRGKPINRELENKIHAWGIIALFAFVIIVDIIHMITI